MGKRARRARLERATVLYTPEAPAHSFGAVAPRSKLFLDLPPSTASVVWHGIALDKHPRSMLCRVNMYPVQAGLLDEAHETPVVLRFCFVEVDGVFHAFDAFDAFGAEPHELDAETMQHETRVELARHATGPTGPTTPTGPSRTRTQTTARSRSGRSASCRASKRSRRPPWRCSSRFRA